MGSGPKYGSVHDVKHVNHQPQEKRDELSLGEVNQIVRLYVSDCRERDTSQLLLARNGEGSSVVQGTVFSSG